MPLHLTTDNLGSTREALIWNDKYTKLEIAARENTLLSLIRGGVSTDGDTLKKLYDKIANIELLIGNGDDADSIVNTLNEVLSAFQGFPENTRLFDLLNGKVNVTDVVNNLETIVAGKVLDARQGKALKDLIDTLTSTKLGKTETAADSARLGGISAANYATIAVVDTKINTALALIRDGVPTDGDTLNKLNNKIIALQGLVGDGNINANNITLGTLSDLRLSPNVALLNKSNVFTQAQTVTRVSLTDVAYGFRTATDGFNRLAITADGSLNFGTGSATPGVRIYSSSSTMLSTTHGFGVEGNLQVNGEIHFRGTTIRDNISGGLFTTSSSSFSTNRILDIANATYSIVNIKAAKLNAPILQEGGVDLSAKYLAIDGRANDSYRLNGQLASFYASNTSVDAKDLSVINLLRDDVAFEGNTLNKLYSQILAIKSIMQDGVSDADNVVNTVSELLDVFKNYPENLNIFDLINSKVNIVDIVNTLDTIVPGKVLDARQGKALKDLYDSLQLNKLEKTGVAFDSARLGGLDASLYATNTSVDSKLSLMRGGVPLAGDNLNKLYQLILSLQNKIFNTNRNGIVETVAELLEIFRFYPEGEDIFALLNGKVDYADVANTLDVISIGQVLDARQGKVLKDLIDAIEARMVEKDGIAADSYRLGGLLPEHYLNASNINTGTLSDLRLSPNVAFVNKPNIFTEAQTIERPLITDSALKLQIISDDFPRLVQRGDGRLIWGSGTSGGDTFIYRYANNWIATNSGGGFRTTDLRAAYLTNLSTSDNSRISLNDSGVEIETIISTNVVLKLKNTLVDATGNLLELANSNGRVAWVDINGVGYFKSINEDGVDLSGKYLGINATAKDSEKLGGQLPGFYDSVASVNAKDTAVINLLRDAVAIDGDTLKKLNDKIVTLQTLVGSTNPDADTIVNTLFELYDVFKTYPEGLDIYTLINARIKIVDIVNDLLTISTTTGKVLDARQGKILKDLVDGLQSSKLDKTAVAADSAMLGGQLPSYYLNANNFNSGTIPDGRLSSNVALRNTTNTFTGTNNFNSSVYFNGSTVGLGGYEWFKVTASHTNMVVLGTSHSTAISHAPMGDIWHDLYAFSKLKVPTFEQTSDGTNWTAATLNKDLFSQKQANTSTVVNYPTTTGARWTWSGGMGFGNGAWLVIGFTWVSGGYPSKTVRFETSADGITWTTRHLSTHSHAAQAVYHFVNDYSGDSHHRLTITHNGTGGNIAISEIQLLSGRPGDQGRGKEFEYPYTWDADQNITVPGRLNAVGNLQENGTWLSSKYLGITAKAADSNMLNGQLASFYASNTSVDTKDTAVIALLREGVPTDGDTLNKLNNKVIALQTLTGINTGVDPDNIVNTLQEVFDVFQTYPENTNIHDLINSKVAKVDIVNNLTTVNTGKVLDASQGKTLKDLVDGLEGSKLNKTESAVDSLKLGGQLPAYYLNASNITTGTLGDGMLSANVAIKHLPNVFTDLQTTSRVDVTQGAFAGKKTSDTINRWAVYVDGKTEWGTGTAVRDTNLYRHDSGKLKTDNTFIASNIGIGTDSPSGRLHLLGIDNTLYIETSINRADVEYKTPTQRWRLGVNADGGNSGDFILRNVTSGNNYLLSAHKATDNITLGSNIDNGARFNVVGKGSTTATVNLLLKNSAGTELFKVNDGGEVWIGANQLTDTSGKIPDSRLSNNVAFINKANNFQVGQTVANSTATSAAWMSKVPTDSEMRWRVQIDGKMVWGPGNATVDTNLYRLDVGVLRTDHELNVGNGVRATTLANTTSYSNAQFKPTNTGGEIITGVSGNTGLKVINTITNATGDLQQWIKDTTIMAKLTSSGSMDTVAGYSWNGQSLDDRYLGINATAKDSERLGGQLPAFYDSVTSVDAKDAAVIALLREAVPTEGDTLKKLHDKIITINAIIGDSAGDNDNIVNTVHELIKVFETYPEGTDIMTLINDRVKYTDIVNDLLTINTTTGKTLDARQGKVLKDLLDALDTNKLDKTGVAADSAKLGDQLPSYYLNATNISAGTLADARLTSNVVLKNVINEFTSYQQFKLATSTTLFLGALISGNTQLQYGIAINGQQSWGDGTNARDTFLYRSGAGILKTDGKFNAVLGLQENGVDLSAKYLGISAKAADSDKLNGQLGSYYLNATNINTGTLSDIRLSVNVPLKNAVNTFTNTNTFNGVTNFSGNTNFTGVNTFDSLAVKRYELAQTTGYSTSSLGARDVTPLLLDTYSDSFAFRPIISAQYHDGVTWVDWSSKISELTNLLDGNPLSKAVIPVDNKHFRFVIDSFAWNEGGLYQVYQEHNGTGTAPYTLTIEIASDSGFTTGVETLASNISFGTNAYFGNHIVHKSTSSKYFRITINTDTTVSSNYRWVKLLTGRIIYGANQGLPFSWDYQRKVTMGGLQVDNAATFSSTITSSTNINATQNLQENGVNLIDKYHPKFTTLADSFLTSNVALRDAINIFTQPQYVKRTGVADGVGLMIDGDAVTRLLLRSDGGLEWGDGLVSRDTNLYREKAGYLKTDGQVTADTFRAVNFSNVTTFNNALINPTNSGTEISTAVASNVVTKFINKNTTPTADITQWIANGVTVAKIDVTGKFFGLVDDTALSNNVAFKNTDNNFTVQQTVKRVGLGDWAYATKVGSETNNRILVLASGKIEWSDGTSASDTTLYRSSIGVLRTDGEFRASYFRGGSLINNGTQGSLGGSFDVSDNGTSAKTSIAANVAFKILNTTTTPTGDLTQWITGINSVVARIDATGKFFGLIDDTALSTNVAFKNVANTFTPIQDFKDIVRLYRNDYGVALRAGVVGVGFWGFEMDTNGKMTWSTDTTLERSGAGVLKSNGNLDATNYRINGITLFGGDNKFLDTSLSTNVALKNVTNLFTARQDVRTTVVTDAAITLINNGDVSWRFSVDGNGRFAWGDGTNIRDTFLYRSAAATLRTDQSLQVGSALTVTGNTTLNGSTNSIHGTKIKIGPSTGDFGGSSSIIEFASANGADFTINYTRSGVARWHQVFVSNTMEWRNNAANTVFYANNSGNVGIGTTTGIARFQVKGSGTTSATTALRIENSAGTSLFVVTDDGAITMGGVSIVKTDDPRLTDKRTPVDRSVTYQQMDPSLFIDINGVPPSEAAKILNPLNWDNISGEYLGAPIINTFAGQRLKDRNYRYEADEDNVWIRLMRA